MENGLTLCVGSFAASSANDVLAIAEKHADKINYVHLRNIATYKSDGSFAESGHLRGDVDMVEAVRICLKEQMRRIAAGEKGGRFKRVWPRSPVSEVSFFLWRRQPAVGLSMVHSLVRTFIPVNFSPSYRYTGKFGILNSAIILR